LKAPRIPEKTWSSKSGKQKFLIHASQEFQKEFGEVEVKDS
jgi:hypothetical protein